MIDISQKEVWFVVGSQELYGEETLRKVAEPVSYTHLTLPTIYSV